MKRLSTLKTLVTLFFAGCMIALAFGLPFILTVVFFPGQVPFKINGSAVEDIHAQEIALMFAVYAACAFYVYALYLFKKTLGLFEKKKIFSDEVIKLLDQTGRAIIIGCIINAVSMFLYKLVAGSNFEIGISISWDSTVFIAGLGLFFIVLGDVFGMAKQMKEENDLTV